MSSEKFIVAAVSAARPLRASTTTLALMAGLVSGCGEAGSAVESITPRSDPVLNGEISPPDEDAVVMVEAVIPGVTRRCTGTLLSPNVVITARHCVANFDDRAFSCTADGELAAGSKGGTMGALYQPSQIGVRMGQRPAPAAAHGTHIFATETPSICRNDIAVVVLDTMLTDYPVSSVRLGRGNTRGEWLRVVGYGRDENNFVGYRRTRSGLEITEIGSSQFREVGDLIPPRIFVTEGPVLCIGDSGGPAFVESGAITAVWSQVAGDCKAVQARSFYTQIAPFADTLLVRAFEEAGTLPTREGATEPGWGDPVGTGGAPSTGGMSWGGSAGSVDPGTGGLAGETGSGGTTGGAGETSGGRDTSGGTETSGGSESSGGNTTAQGGEFTFSGPRKKGGCTCDHAGAEPSGKAAWLAPLLLLLLGMRRRRPTPSPIPVRIDGGPRPARGRRSR